MQRMISHPEGLPACRQGHPARHIQDARRASAGGGHHVECACGRTDRHAEFADALREWCRRHGHPIPKIDPQRDLPLGNVMRLRRTFR